MALIGTGIVGTWVERMPWQVRFIFPIIVGTDLGRCLQIRVMMRPGQVAKKPLSMTCQKVGTAR